MLPHPPNLLTIAGKQIWIATLAVGIVTLLMPAGPAEAALRPYTYIGVTSQQLPMSFKIPHSFVGVRSFQLRWTASCASGATFSDTTHVRGAIPFLLSRHGLRWRSTGSYSFSDVAPDGRKLTDYVTVLNTGVAKPLYPKGTWQATATIVDQGTGQTIDTCRTGQVTWAANMTL